MSIDENRLKAVCDAIESLTSWIVYVNSTNECAYSDSMLKYSMDLIEEVYEENSVAVGSVWRKWVEDKIGKTEIEEFANSLITPRMYNFPEEKYITVIEYFPDTSSGGSFTERRYMYSDIINSVLGKLYENEYDFLEDVESKFDEDLFCKGDKYYEGFYECWKDKNDYTEFNAKNVIRVIAEYLGVEDNRVCSVF